MSQDNIIFKSTPDTPGGIGFRHKISKIIKEMTFLVIESLTYGIYLPPSITDFTSFNKFDESLSNDYLLL